MIDMYALNSTEVRKDFSAVIDKVVREKPVFIKRTRDHMLLSDVRFMEAVLNEYTFSAERFTEDDGSITLSLSEIDLVENAPTVAECIKALAQSILDYADDFYREYSYWSSAPNRKTHIPYVFKALILGDAEKVGAIIQCRDGQN